MKQNWHCGLACGVAFIILPSSALSEHNWVDSLKVRRVRQQGQMHMLARYCGPVEGGAQMVLHIT
jgi:hypothetical protein